MLNENEVRAIFAPFADQETKLDIRETESSISIKLFFSGEERNYLYDKEKKTILDRKDHRTYSSINVLLASNLFSDLSMMANAQIRILKEKHKKTPLLAEVNVVSQGVGRMHKLEENFCDFVDKILVPMRDNNKTKILLIDGPAGIGKTYFIERLAFEHAQHYAERQTSFPPILHTTSRGRRLSVLNDAVAATIQDFRAEGKFSYEQVPVLVRQGLLYLAIDGFDELVDADGYSHAWRGLSDYLEKIKHSGVCILAGRDTFFDQDEFIKRLSYLENELEIIQLHLLNVNQQEASRWLIARGWSNEELERLLPSEDDSYYLRPYFLHELASVEDKRLEHIVSQSSELKNFLIKRFIYRESNVITDSFMNRDDKDYSGLLEKIGVQLTNLMCNVALDMSERESESIDLDWILFLCEYDFKSILNDDQLRKLIHRVRAVGLLEKCEIDNHRKFPHSEIRQYFASQSIVKELLNEKIPFILRRGILGTDFLENFRDVFANTSEFSDPDAKKFMEFLVSKVESETSSDRFSQNSSALLFACLFREPFPLEIPILLKNIYSTEVYLSGLPSSGNTKVRLKASSITRLDARDADLADIEFSEVCEISILLANSATTFGNFIPKISMIYLESFNKGVSFEKINNPDEIRTWLCEHSTINEDNAGKEKYKESSLYKLYERICRFSIKKRFLRPKTDQTSTRLYTAQDWGFIEELLEEYKLLHQYKTAEVHTIAIETPRLLLSPQPNTPQYEVRQKIIEEASKAVA